MRNTITLNGIRSETIDGLLIQELPPIIKPEMRTEIEEVDGIDGSIVTKLGYSAYEKEMVIGLHGAYNIDEVISYFNSEGEVIFGNEPDKVYQYQILDEIDFERLASFRTAVVTFYVQPFKHSAVKDRASAGSSAESLVLFNYGNVIAKPLIYISGTGSVDLYLNGTKVFRIALGSSITIMYIDVAKMEAYKSNGTLMNRYVAGDYDDLCLAKGENVLTWSGGNVQQIYVEKISRWI